MRYFLDTEFIDDGKTIDLISIGIVAEDGREHYAQSVEFKADKASDWVREHIFPTLLLHETPVGKSPHAYRQGLLNNTMRNHRDGQCEDDEHGKYADCPWRTRAQIKHDILSFMDVEAYGKPELWGWCSGYDWVVFCQLFGTMMDLPTGYPHYIKDFQQVLDERGISDDELPEQEDGLHNALADAQHLKKLWGYILRNDCWQ